MAARLALGLAVEAMKGRSLGPASPRVTFAGAASDSREVEPGQMFFALPGERVDGFDFCVMAVERGAAVVVVEARRGRPRGCDRIPVVAVADPRRALGDLARAVRGRFTGTVVAVAGSNGKTTSKELVAAALSSAGKVARTSGNRNTDVGLPLTILGAAGDERFWVLEMAMRGLGEVATLCRIARPHVGLVTNVGPEHMEILRTIDNVARANGEIYAGLEPGGCAVLPVDEPLLAPHAAAVARDRRVTFGGAGSGAAVEVLESIGAGAAGQVARFAVRRAPVVARLPLPGAHNARNAAAALAAALAAGIPVAPAARALAGVALPPHRSAALPVAGRVVLDDCYNANPASMSAALGAVAAQAAASGRAYAILGDMLEVGDASPDLHAALGAEAARQHYAGLAIVGAMASHVARGAREAGLAADRIVTPADPEDAARRVAGWSAPGDWILVKASRGMRLERAVESLRRFLDAGTTEARSAEGVQTPDHS